MEMCQTGNIFVLPAGEYCNSLISTAYMICRYVNNYLFVNKEKFGSSGISKAFDAKGVGSERLDAHNTRALGTLGNDGKIYQTNNCPFQAATPNSNRNMGVDSHIKHPVTFVLSSLKIKNEKGILEHSPLFDLLVNDAHDACRCVLSVNIELLQNEIRYMDGGGKIVTIGEKAFEHARYLQKSSIDMSVVPSDELLKND